MMDSVPIQGKTYFCYDDGKVRVSRQYRCIIKEVVPFEKVNKEIKSEWKKVVEEDPHLFSLETDYIIIGEVSGDVERFQYFARTTYGGWFSFAVPMQDDVGQSLDVDGNLTLKLIQSRKDYINKYCKQEKPQYVDALNIEVDLLIKYYNDLYK